MANEPNSSRRSLVWMLRIAALVVVCVGVSGTVRGALAQLSKHEWSVRPTWLIASGIFYVLGMLPIGLFWRHTIRAFGYDPPVGAALRAYYFGQLGKYVPGKAMVIILRVAAVRRWAPSMRLVIMSVFIETLTMMAIGALLACLLSAFVLKLDAYVWLIALGMSGAAGLPTLPPVLRWFGKLGIGRFSKPDDAAATKEDPATTEARIRGLTFGTLAVGWIASLICWLLFATSLWATLRSIGVDNARWLADMPTLITAVAFAVVAGFLSMLPGGLVVRDGILMKLLAPLCGDANALIAAVLMRLVWLVSEVAACGILYIGKASRGRGPEITDRGSD